MNEIQFDKIVDALAGPGFSILDDALPSNLLQCLLVDMQQLPAEEFRSAGIGRQVDFQLQETIRSDHIHWLTSTTDAVRTFLQIMEALRAGINQRLFLGLFDYESHFAIYPKGAFYKKHVDAFRNRRSQHQANRVLSTVLYLNENWQLSDGGELLIYAEDGDAIIQKVQPVFGRMVIFLSEKFPHEVLPATRERKSIAGWFRVNEGIR